ncbi:signal peptide peptidase SppA [candidate division LCP-89 bacterium B3_LCP]|uniref:Signal peptide peptidase SppA n=1 Tax=candidate division LCP-89 bacterium B3_LCP TaxID=2012998 RepID=A0A532V2B3_UNCL8|nr:MAG: signal peptide peptidase SppA [candidate division LCP-89 bacterium B3_LCP]
MSRRKDIFVLLFFLVFFFVALYLIFGTFTADDTFKDVSLVSGEKIGLIRVLGGIYDPEPILDQLDRAEESSGVKALIIRLETPGGSVAASQEIYQRVADLRDETEIPIIASMGNIAASGGYYIAMGVDTIMANPGTITGSIGVIFSFPQYYELFEKIGLSHEVLKSGRFKDTGSPLRSMDKAERQYLQALIDDSYQQFIETVAAERGMDLSEVELLADGRVYTGRQAKESNLIDMLGTYHDAIDLAAELGGISGTPDVVDLAKEKGLTLYDLLFGDLMKILTYKFGLTMPLKYEMVTGFP